MTIDTKTMIEETKAAFDLFKKTNDEKAVALGDKMEAKAKELDLKADRIASDVASKIETLQKAEEKRTADFDAMTRKMRMAGGAGASSKSDVQIEGERKSFELAVQSARKNQGVTVSADEMADYQKHFMAAMSKDKDMLTDAERKALNVGVLTDGGYTVPPEFDNAMVKRMREYSAFMQAVTVQQVSTDKIVIPVQTTGADAGEPNMAVWTTEGQVLAQTNTPKFNQITVNLNELRALPGASQWMLDDPMLQSENFLAEETGIAFARAIESALIVGTGVNMPNGLLNYPSGTGFGQIERINAGAASFTSGANQVDALMNLIMAPGSFQGYLGSSKFMMNRGTLLQIMKLKDTQNNYLVDISRDKDNGGFPTFYVKGYETILNLDMPVAAAGALAVAFGDFKRAYRAIVKNGTTVIRDVFTARPYVVFDTRKRIGGGVVDFRAVRLLQMA